MFDFVLLFELLEIEALGLDRKIGRNEHAEQRGADQAIEENGGPNHLPNNWLSPLKAALCATASRPELSVILEE